MAQIRLVATVDRDNGTSGGHSGLMLCGGNAGSIFGVVCLINFNFTQIPRGSRIIQGLLQLKPSTIYRDDIATTKYFVADLSGFTWNEDQAGNFGVSYATPPLYEWTKPANFTSSGQKAAWDVTGLATDFYGRAYYAIDNNYPPAAANGFIVIQSGTNGQPEQSFNPDTRQGDRGVYWITREDATDAFRPELIVTYNRAPGCVNTSAGNYNTTAATLNFSWAYSDPDGDPQSAFQIVGSVDGSGWRYDSGAINSNATSYTGAVPEGAYQWFAIRVWDGNDWSAWSYVYNIKVDRSAPTGNLSINGGATRYAATVTTVTLAIVATDSITSVSQMMLSNDPGFAGSAWETYATSKTWTPTAGLGMKTVYVKFKDVVGNVSSTYTASILHNSPPVASFSTLANNSTIYNVRPKVKVTGTDPDGNGTITQYQLDFSSDPGFSTLVSSSLVSGIDTFTPSTDLTTGTWYARVRANDGVDWSPFVNVIFTINSFTGNILDADTGAALHWITELRTANNNIRTARGMTAFTFTDSLTADTTQTRAIHLTELRTAYEQIAALIGVTVSSWTDPVVTADTTNRLGKHWNEIRQLAVKL